MELNANAFARNARKALLDKTLQEALKRTTGRFQAHRDAAVAAFPEFERPASARRGSSGRSSTIWTRTSRASSGRRKTGRDRPCGAGRGPGAEIAARIARDEGITLAVKSKSMAAEEISLNGALQGAGVTVVESDLGEYILQLAGETPSHIIAPAVHKTREEISRLFERHLGSRGPTASRAGRDGPQAPAVEVPHRGDGRLRRELLVADTGSVVLVTNEGNGRMGTTCRASTSRSSGSRRSSRAWRTCRPSSASCRAAPPGRRSRRTCRS